MSYIRGVDGKLHWMGTPRHYQRTPLSMVGARGHAPRRPPAVKRWRVWFYIAIHLAGLENAPLREWVLRWREWGAV